MTRGQERALRELGRLVSADIGTMEIIGPPLEREGFVFVTISVRIGPIKTKSGGLVFKERERFIISISPEFPFDYPHLSVGHRRFAGFPHVNWGKHICLYQSAVEWNPADGMYGFFDRLKLWLLRAAENDMDPIEGPLHPPVHLMDSSLPSIIIRANLPVNAGEHWLGLAELKKYPNRIELIGWNDFTRDLQQDCQPALTIVLPDALPVEFPINGKEFFVELNKQGIDKSRVLLFLGITAKITPEGEPAFLVLGIPMRRSPRGESRHHVAVWSIGPENTNRLKLAFPSDKDTKDLRDLKDEMNEILHNIFEMIPIKWHPVMEDRSEIVVKRDIGRPVAWFDRKKVLILGCGALGSWAAEIIARANPNLIHLVDNSKVNPGMLSRQNFGLDDIGSSKAEALANRIRALMSSNSVSAFYCDAHHFIIREPERLENYDLVLDLTASKKFQMKLERDWGSFFGRTPPFISIVIDANAQRCLTIVLKSNAGGGIWDAYIQLKDRLCLDDGSQEFVSAFYSEQATKALFQPEPGCSDPTFSGSTTDIYGLISTALNISIDQISKENLPVGLAFSVHNKDGRRGVSKNFKLYMTGYTLAGPYRVSIRPNVFRVIKSWVQHNNRIRSREHETGGLLWGLWDDAVGVIWVFDASGPPPDSLHNPQHFICGVKGTLDEHKNRLTRSCGTSGFIGLWHTHPNMPSIQSPQDIGGMAELISTIGQNQRKAIMLIVGHTGGQPIASIYVYESQSLTQMNELISVGMTEIALETPVV